VLILSRSEVEAVLDLDALLEAVAEGLMALASGGMEAPPRQGVAADGGTFLTMAGRRAGAPVAVKLVGVFPGNVELGLDPHPAVICLFDASTGRALAFMDGEAITGLRTAAASAVSVRALAREDARVLAVVGSGVQAQAHLRMLPLVREFSDVRLVARDPSAAARLGVAAGSVEGADVVCLCTSSSQPVLSSVAPGVHVTSVGFAPPGGELDPALAASSRLFVETLQAFSPPPAGCAELAGLDSSLGTELGAVLAGRAPGRVSDDDVTVYKAMGHIAEDAAAAELVYRAALSAGVGRDVDVEGPPARRKP
jgi:ornithine cyclodeaminase/alanine dehydrogenase-like protein (mu-crystallin family)